MKFKLILISFMLSAVAYGQVQFTCSAPSSVIAGKPFNIVYSINTREGSNLMPPEFTGFELLAGPYSSTISNRQSINGKVTQSVTVSYSYTLMAEKAGTYSLAPASITVNGEKTVSNGAQIKVLEADKVQEEQQQNSGNSQPAIQGLTADKLFVRAIVSKSNPYEQEPVLVTYKVYTLVDLSHIPNMKFPDFKGFLKQDFESRENLQLAYESYNGRNYGTAILYQTILFPQHAGEITIDKATFDAVVRVQNVSQRRSIFDDFFDSYTNVNRQLIANPVKIDVKPLPENKPSGFDGIVGRFTLSSSISANEIKANQAVTVKVTINGSGNMKLIKTPEIRFPDGFEVYEPKILNNFKATAGGVNGSKIIEYMFIPRYSGDFEIAPAEFSYFDTQDKIYKTLKMENFRLTVQKDGSAGETAAAAGSVYVNKEDVKQLGMDIRYIETGNITPAKNYKYIFGTFAGWLAYLVPLLVALALYFIFRKNVRDSSDIELVKNRRANRIAQKRLRGAKKLLNEGKKDLFYEEIMKGLWNYLSDKLNIPAAQLTKDSVEQELAGRGIDEPAISKIKEILNICEFARYAPPAENSAMGNLYEETILQISNIESKIRKK